MHCPCGVVSLGQGILMAGGGVEVDAAGAGFHREGVRQAASFDLITAFDAVHDQAAPDLVLRRAREALAADGVFLAIDVKASSDLAGNLDHPLGPYLYGVSVMHCMSVSLAEGGPGLGTMCMCSDTLVWVAPSRRTISSGGARPRRGVAAGPGSWLSPQAPGRGGLRARYR